MGFTKSEALFEQSYEMTFSLGCKQSCFALEMSQNQPTLQPSSIRQRHFFENYRRDVFWLYKQHIFCRTLKMQYGRSYDHLCVLAPYAAPIDKFCYFLISCVEYMYYLICSEVGCKLLHWGEEIREKEIIFFVSILL